VPPTYDTRYTTSNILPPILLTRHSRYVTVKPTCISVGDIVELQVSFIMVPLCENKLNPTMVLRSILVLDHTYTQVRPTHHCLIIINIISYVNKKVVAKHFAQLRAPNLIKPVESMKRCVGYFEEQLSTMRAKLSDMQVDEADEAEVENSSGIGAVLQQPRHSLVIAATEQTSLRSLCLSLSHR
jgi:hypothetical protein